jgi:hypothetical protein
MSKVTTKTVEINAAVAIEESTFLIGALRDRNLANAQARFDLTQVNQALGQQLAELQKKLETLLLQAEANGPIATDDAEAIVEPVANPEA